MGRRRLGLRAKGPDLGSRSVVALEDSDEKWEHAIDGDEKDRVKGDKVGRKGEVDG